jgi:hypothetical protein
VIDPNELDRGLRSMAGELGVGSWEGETAAADMVKSRMCHKYFIIFKISGWENRFLIRHKKRNIYGGAIDRFLGQIISPRFTLNVLMNLTTPQLFFPCSNIWNSFFDTPKRDPKLSELLQYIAHFLDTYL